MSDTMTGSPALDAVNAALATVQDPEINRPLTGMGHDGGAGAAWIKARGGCILTEAEETCVVYGMPRAAAERGGADHQMPIGELAGWLATLRAGSPSGGPAPR